MNFATLKGHKVKPSKAKKYFFAKTYAQSPLCENHIDFISSMPDLGVTGVTLVNPKSSA